MTGTVNRIRKNPIKQVFLQKTILVIFVTRMVTRTIFIFVFTKSAAQAVQHIPYVGVDAYGLCTDFFGALCLAQVDAGVYCLRVLIGHLPEGVLDDAGGVAADTQLQKEYTLVFIGIHKIAVTCSGGMPACVLHKAMVGAQIHAHGLAAYRAAWNQAARYTSVLLLRHHLPHDFFVVVCGIVAGLGALKQAVIALCVEEPLLIKARLLEAVIHIGAEHKIIFVFDQLQQLFVNRFGRIHIAVDVDIAAPVRPFFLQAVEGEKARGVHVLKAVGFDKIGKMLCKTRAAVRKACRGR